MGDERYYRDAPRFKRRDPLTTWSYVFLLMAVASVAWIILIFFLTASGMVRGAPDAAFGLSRTAWVTITVLLLGASIVGLLFTIFARLGATQGGGYLSTLDTAVTPRTTGRPDPGKGDASSPNPTQPAPAAPTGAPTPPEGGGEYARSGTPHPQQLVTRSTARVETTLGPDGRVLLSYTVPEDQPRGLYADTYVPVDSDAVLNIKSLLAKTPTA